MLPTFVIGLREGLEAALIVGIIAAFLKKQNRTDLLRWVLAGVGVAVLLCFGAGIALKLYSQDLPQRQQEGLETVIGVLAVGMVTYMVIWMKRHSRQLKGQLEGMAADALASGASGFTAGKAMVFMAFLAVIREGLETVVFLLAAFNEAGSSSAAGLGAVLGIAVAIGLGYGIYRGGVKLNLSKFFRATGLVLVLVAAGLVVNALHTAHEAGWLTVGQGSTVDLSWLVAPGTVQASLLTGMLGIQSHPVLIEAIGWLAYLIPVGVYVAWPPGKTAPARLIARISAVVCAVAAIAALVLTLVAPSTPAQRPTTRATGISARVLERAGNSAVVRTETRSPIAGSAGSLTNIRVTSGGEARRAGLATEVFQASVPGRGATGRPAVLDLADVARLNGGRLPLGFGGNGASTVAATYRDTDALTVWLDTRTDRVIDIAWSERVLLSVRSANGNVATLDRPIASAQLAVPAAAVGVAVAAARAAHDDLDQRSRLHTIAAWCVALAVLAALCAVAFWLVALRRVRLSVQQAEPVETLVRS